MEVDKEQKKCPADKCLGHEIAVQCEGSGERFVFFNTKDVNWKDAYTGLNARLSKVEEYLTALQAAIKEKGEK